MRFSLRTLLICIGIFGMALGSLSIFAFLREQRVSNLVRSQMNKSQAGIEASMEQKDPPSLPIVHSKDFKKWRNPIRGTENPQVMNNPFWEWCVLSGEHAYGANQHFDGPDSAGAGPCWCFERMGQTSTELPDGRVVYVAGEHEDYYDPDFYIYNDVVVKHPDGMLDIFGYPQKDFKPTDFHTATLVGTDLILIGNLGYPNDREINQTQIYRLDTRTWKIEEVVSHGENPGWIHKHEVTLSEDQRRIVLTGGILADSNYLENIEDWELNLENWTWRKLTDRNWQRWVFKRSDDESNRLWEMRQVLWDQEHGGMLNKHMQETFADFPPEIVEEIMPDDDLLDDPEILKSLYHPPASAEPAVDVEEEYGVYRLQIDGVLVRYNEDMGQIVVTIEGQLPENIVEEITSDLKSKLSALEKCEYVVEKH